MKKLTAAWVRKAEDDFQTARSLARGARLLHDQVCFHCQQSTEKYFKAMLQELGLPIPRTHDVSAILMSLAVSLPAPKLQRGAVFLTQFAVNTRYPGDSASRRQAKAAMRWADRIRQAVRDSLGIPRRKRPR
jgi:HEPN domain-containing protein